MLFVLKYASVPVLYYIYSEDAHVEAQLVFFFFFFTLDFQIYQIWDYGNVKKFFFW